ncbi:hypothetical protein BDW22DRAFT_1321114 [Trametopsis cervina]|nr:hypothetical protein BDW22DRAFT_1321114 [Trametopsis cervina]
MDGGWEDHLHFELLGEHVLFPSLHLDSASQFIQACILTVVICVAERCLTYAMTTNWSPSRWTKRTRFRKAIWKASLYWMATLLRLLYMLVAMTFSIWLIVLTVTTLAAGQFIIEYLETPDYSSGRDPEHMKEPLLATPPPFESSYPLHPYGVHEHANDEYPYRISSSSASSSSLPHAHSPIRENTTPESQMGRPRSKSKPDAIWIHPTESNLARADARAMQLGLSGDTELVKSNQLPPDSEPAWEVGKGKDLAREIMRAQK